MQKIETTQIKGKKLKKEKMLPPIAIAGEVERKDELIKKNE